MHLVVIIPAYNEEQTIADVIREVPEKLMAITQTTILVIDDGSTDSTAAIAKEAGAVVVSHEWRQGLAECMRTAYCATCEFEPDVIVTIDADGQYDPLEIPKLLEPVLAHQADLVVGDRQVRARLFMPAGNRYGNIVGSFLLRHVIGLPIADASSGFRCLSSAAWKTMHFRSLYTYTHEMLIIAKSHSMRMHNTLVDFRPRVSGGSKLVRTLRNHLARSIGTILRCMLTVDPLRTFMRLGCVTFLFGAAFILVPVAVAVPHSGFWQGFGAFVSFVGCEFCIVGFIAEVLRPTQS